MSNLAKLEFIALDIAGKNYLSWVLDAEIHLDAKGLGETIKEPNKATSQDKAKAMIFLLHHLHEGLKNKYLTVKDPQILWSNLKERYDHQKTVILPKSRYDWLNLRLQYFKSISEYNSGMFKIISQLKLCGENITDVELLEKTYSTFHANNVVLQTQYREKGLTKYSELKSCLLVAKQNNELLMKNHELRPVGSTPFPEANVTTHHGKENINRDYSSSSGRGRGRGRGRGQWRGCGRGHGYGRGRGFHFKNSHSHQKWERRDDKVNKERSGTDICYRCGVKGHWSRKVEANLVLEDGNDDFDFGNTTHLEVADFLISPKENNIDFGNTTHLEVADFFTTPEGNN
ncbi:uncharacterized protein LOC110734153 [Chenopodium quinoa]|uniref:uncharacterized protein LOC110734153 n=1 Tax=Chenopodium quinoa TaxID=63459 RepID=UPI000B783A68|nr:uncharacterized protein LOC110734153 [Chenopodium quinoa]